MTGFGVHPAEPLLRHFTYQMQVMFRSRRSRYANRVVSTTLIDPLEQRLLYSADHPLGLAVALDDDNGLQDVLQADHQSALALAARIDLTEDDTTGHIDRDGNWELEWRYGAVDTTVLDAASLDDWQGSLLEIIVDTELDTVDGDTSSLTGFQNNPGADGKISLREAVQVANNDASVSLITLNVLEGNPDYALTSGELEMSGHYVVAGAGAVDTVIDQQTDEVLLSDEHRVVNVSAGADITLTGLTLTGGTANEDGGGIFIEDTAAVTLQSVIIHDNATSEKGGGIFSEGALAAQDVRLTLNTADNHGGGIYAETAMSLNRVTIDHNVSALNGGGVYQNSSGDSSTFDFVTISSNEARTAGGIDAKGDMLIQNSTIVLNSADAKSGGIYRHGGGVLSIRNTVLADNSLTGGPGDTDDYWG